MIDNASIPVNSSGNPSGKYQILLTILLSLNFGIALFDRNALSFLMPFIQDDIDINNTQVGILTAALPLT